jgi:hypothetical protein
LNEPSNVPDSAYEAIITNLGVKIAPSYGRTPTNDTKITAKQAYDTLLARATAPIEQQLPSTMPIGSGNKSWRWSNPFVPRPVDPVLAGSDGLIDFN